VAADATLASSQAQLLPSINLTATGSLQDRTLPDLLDNPLRCGASAAVFWRRCLTARR
jgi:outer membrane protein TolC